MTFPISLIATVVRMPTMGCAASCVVPNFGSIESVSSLLRRPYL